MIQDKRVCAVIPARAGSKRLPGKNLRALKGYPMIYYSIAAALECRYVDAVVVSTEDEEIAKVARGLGVSVVMRDAEMASDAAEVGPVCRHALRETEARTHLVYDFHALLQPTSPLRTAAHLAKALERVALGDVDSVQSVRMLRENTGWMKRLDGGVLSPLGAETLYPNGAIYVTSRAIVLERGAVLGDRVAPFIMAYEESIDVDTAADFEAAEDALRRRDAWMYVQ
jgi:CMP-N,N'-diacetyllegionaminic acid synthase